MDVRQGSLYGLAWTLGSLKYLAESGVHSITYYETTGWRGVMEQENGAALPHKFFSSASGVYPVYHLFADIAEFAGGWIWPVQSSQPLCLEGLLLEKDQEPGAAAGQFYTANPAGAGKRCSRSSLDALD